MQFTTGSGGTGAEKEALGLYEVGKGPLGQTASLGGVPSVSGLTVVFPCRKCQEPPTSSTTKRTVAGGKKSQSKRMREDARGDPSHHAVKARKRKVVVVEPADPESGTLAQSTGSRSAVLRPNAGGPS